MAELRGWSRAAPLRAAGAVAVLLWGAGCSPCETYCARVAEVYDECLGEWEMSWTQVGAPDGPEQFEEQCVEEERERRAGLSDEELEARQDACAAFNEAIAGADTCEERFEVFETYGVVF